MKRKNQIRKKAPRPVRTNAFIDNGVEKIVERTNANFSLLAKFSLTKLIRLLPEHPEWLAEIKAQVTK